MACTSVVRLGPTSNNVSAIVLRNALLSYFEEIENGDKSLSRTPNSGDNDNKSNNNIDDKPCPTITISNKYFTAKVKLSELGEVESSSSSPLSAPMPQNKEDGVILAFDALQSNPDHPPLSSDGSKNSSSFDSLSYVHGEAEKNAQCGDLLRLCVGVSLSNMSPTELRGKDHEAEYSRRILWCLDRGYEYVEADLSQEGQTKGHSDRDKDGFARIVEAIQGTVWSSAVMSKSKKQELKQTYQNDTAEINGMSQTNDGDETKIDDRFETENPYEPPDPSKLGFPEIKTSPHNEIIDKNDDDKKATNQESKDADVTGMLLEPNKVGPEEILELRKQAETEHLFDQMEGALREAARVREAAKNGALSDEDRRQRAGDAAMALMNLMDKFGLDDDDKGSQEDSSVDDDSQA